jgi:hypothetical protein
MYIVGDHHWFGYNLRRCGVDEPHGVHEWDDRGAVLLCPGYMPLAEVDPGREER